MLMFPSFVGLPEILSWGWNQEQVRQKPMDMGLKEQNHAPPLEQAMEKKVGIYRSCVATRKTGYSPY